MSPSKGSALFFCSNTSEVAAAGAEGTEAKSLSADGEDGKKRKLQWRLLTKSDSIQHFQSLNQSLGLAQKRFGSVSNIFLIACGSIDGHHS